MDKNLIGPKMYEMDDRMHEYDYFKHEQGILCLFLGADISTTPCSVGMIPPRRDDPHALRDSLAIVLCNYIFQISASSPFLD